MAKNNNSSNEIKIDTQLIADAANEINTINNSLETDFATVSRSITRLDTSWDGTAATKAMSTFYSIKSEMTGSYGRKAILNTYIEFLKNIVAYNYESTENTNIKLADLFK